MYVWFQYDQGFEDSVLTTNLSVTLWLSQLLKVCGSTSINKKIEVIDF